MHEGTRAAVLSLLERELPGRNLYDLAASHGITVRKDGKLNKGWAGQTVEKVARLDGGNRKHRDGVDFELKSTSLLPSPDGSWRPKETIKVTMLNPEALLMEPFEESALWDKLRRLVLVGLHHESDALCRVVRVSAFDADDPDLVRGIRGYWEEIRRILSEGEIATYDSLGTSDGWLQLRPTGTGRTVSVCPVTGEKFGSLAFYATKPLVARVLGLDA